MLCNVKYEEIKDYVSPVNECVISALEYHSASDNSTYAWLHEVKESIRGKSFIDINQIV